MTTPIMLTVGAITLTFNKWEIGVDHGMLFQESDRQRRRHLNQCLSQQISSTSNTVERSRQLEFI